ncbi:hypothetical protein F5884DRAFT_862218 [Xylogone sp. PMI_703]|nr:hypothetical protein F5884DRAFT_862218 [Xylogone sp. PMI_703]
MAEDLGVVTGVLGLLPLCRDGFVMIKEIFESNGSLDLVVGRIELQCDRYDEWREIWLGSTGEKDIRFEQYAKDDPESAEKVLRQLALLSHALFDVQALEEQYGIKLGDRSYRVSRSFDTYYGNSRQLIEAPKHAQEAKDLSHFKLKISGGQELTPEIQATFIDRCRINMFFIRKSKFVFKKGEVQASKLIDLLKEYTETLRSYGPQFELTKMIKSGFDHLKNLEKDALERLAEAAAFEANQSPLGNTPKGRYNELAIAASFGTVVRFERQHTIYKFTMNDFRIEHSYQLSSSELSTMALLFDYPVKKENRVVLIEWVENLDRENERETGTKALMLAAPKPPQLLLPTCYGMVDDPDNGRLGLVLAPPEHIRSHLPQILTAGAISRKRMPISLKELLEKRHPSYVERLELGVRFQLAKKFIDAIRMMHCVGWVHKNISSENIIFFAARHMSTHGVMGPDPNSPQQIGFDEPLFVGIGDPRLDDTLGEPHTYYLTRGDEIPTPDLDYYHHPDRRADPLMRYSRSHDIYSIGVVLLEIGIWRPLEEVAYVQSEDFLDTQKQFQKLALKLDGITGSIYGNVVRRCLAINTRERTEAQIKDLSRFCAEISASLDRCIA